jgi:tetratricopeptide (TPR) repeat protein
MLFFPKGDYGHLSLDTDLETLQILHQVTEKHFAMGLGASQNGFVSPGFDPIRLGGRVVPASWGTDQLMDHLEGQNALVRARLELAKVLSWHSQYARANQWFRKAEYLGADPVEVNFNWGRNASRQGDMPTALEKLRRAKELAPDFKKIRSALEEVELRKRPLLDAHIFASEDSDNRSITRWGSGLEGYVNDSLLLEGFGDDYRWKRDGLGSEDGVRFGVGALWHFAEERWLRARLWHLSLEESSDEFCGSLNVHWPNAPISGYFDAGAERQQVDTVEAVRKGIMAYTYYLRTYSLIHDRWDVLANLSFTNRTDNNDTRMLEGRFVRRLNEWPYFGLGYLFRFADSDEELPEYWAPMDLQQHQLYAEMRWAVSKLHFSLSGRWGYVEEEDTDWRWTWGAKLRTDYQVTPRLGLYGEVNRLELATYDSLSGLLGANFRF